MARRALTVSAIALVSVGVLLVLWSIAPAVGGFDAPKSVLDKALTGPKGDKFASTPFAELREPGGSYDLRITAKEAFVVGERRADRPDDSVREAASLSYNAGGDPEYYYETQFRSTIASDDPAGSEAGPKVFFIKFPASAGPVAYHATATFTPTWSPPFIFLKAWASIVGLVLGLAGLITYVVRAAMPAPAPRAPEPEPEGASSGTQPAPAPERRGP